VRQGRYGRLRADRHCVDPIDDLAVSVGPVPIPPTLTSLETDRVDIVYPKVRMQTCTEVELPRSGVLDAKLQFERGAAHRNAQLAREGMGPKLARVARIFEAKRRAAIAFAGINIDDTPIERACEAMVGNEPYVENCGNTTGTPPRMGQDLPSALLGLRNSRTSSPA